MIGIFSTFGWFWHLGIECRGVDLALVLEQGFSALLFAKVNM